MAGQLSLVFQLCTRIFKIHFDEMSFKCSRQKIPFPDQQRRHRSVAQHRQGAGGVSGVPVAHPQLQHPLHPSAAAVMAGPSVHHQPLFSTTSSQGEFSQFENCSNYAKYGQTSVTFKTKYNWIVSGFSLPLLSQSCVLLCPVSKGFRVLRFPVSAFLADAYFIFEKNPLKLPNDFW